MTIKTSTLTKATSKAEPKAPPKPKTLFTNDDLSDIKDAYAKAKAACEELRQVMNSCGGNYAQPGDALFHARILLRDYPMGKGQLEQWG